jgi:uncharacterized protein (TIGR02145 family)
MTDKLKNLDLRRNKVPSKVTDIDGNEYNTVIIGTQVWMVENLKTSRYQDGVFIPIVPNNGAWAGLTTGAYCWYDNNPENANTYGVLYNYYAVVDDHNLCPIDWHVPTIDEWATLVNYLDEEKIAGCALKESGILHWDSPNFGFDNGYATVIGASNDSGFTAIPGGLRYLNGRFDYIRESGNWWSSTEDNVDEDAKFMFMRYNAGFASYHGSYNKKFGFSVRCIWNETL